MSNILNIHNLSKKFSNKLVLNGINFTMSSGEICGLVGPNGSGKTTLLNILMGMLKPTLGSFQLRDGLKVGMSVSRKGFFSDMSVWDNILLMAKLANVEVCRVSKTMDDFLIDFRKFPYGKISAGMKQRVSLIIPFLTNNELILLDEPFNHLDIDSILILRNKISQLKEEGVSILITSHILSDLEKICDRILFLKDGELQLDRSTLALIQEFGTIENAYLSIK
jgi:ABC-2 type transport system ATP-binding protein